MGSALFIHRSVGHNLLADGHVYDLLQREDVELSDYDQNTDTLTSDGAQTNPGFTFPGGNTRPEDYSQIFTEQVAVTYKPILDTAMVHDVVIIKSCYPNSNIKSEDELERIKGQYKSIAAFFASKPNRQLIILTSPPLVPLMTNPNAAARARQLAAWLAKTQLAPNVSVFNFFDLLAIPEGQRQANTLQKIYRRLLPIDSHPNTKASKEIAPKFVAFLTACKL